MLRVYGLSLFLIAGCVGVVSATEGGVGSPVVRTCAAWGSNSSSPESSDGLRLLNDRLAFVNDLSDKDNWVDEVFQCLSEYKGKRAKSEFILTCVLRAEILDSVLFSDAERVFACTLLQLLFECVQLCCRPMDLPGTKSSVVARELFAGVMDFVSHCRNSVAVRSGKPLFSVLFDVYSRCGESINFYDYVMKKLYII